MRGESCFLNTVARSCLLTGKASAFFTVACLCKIDNWTNQKEFWNAPILRMVNFSRNKCIGRSLSWTDGGWIHHRTDYPRMGDATHTSWPSDQCQVQHCQREQEPDSLSFSSSTTLQRNASSVQGIPPAFESLGRTRNSLPRQLTWSSVGHPCQCLDSSQSWFLGTPIVWGHVAPRTSFGSWRPQKQHYCASSSSLSSTAVIHNVVDGWQFFQWSSTWIGLQHQHHHNSSCPHSEYGEGSIKLPKGAPTTGNHHCGESRRSWQTSYRRRQSQQRHCSAP